MVQPRYLVGTYQLKGDVAERIASEALSQGLRLIDTAAIYHNESSLSHAILQCGLDRSKLFITSKLSSLDHGSASASLAFAKSLSLLNLAYLDLYLIHWPALSGLPLDSDEHAIKRKESWRMLEQLYDQGKVRAIGVSNYTVKHLKELLGYARIRPQVNQIELHPLLQQSDVVDFCKENQIVIQAYSSLGQGALLVSDRVKEMAQRYGKSPASICLKWAIQKDWLVIPRTSNPEHLKQIIDPLKDEWQIEPSDMAKLDDMDADKRYCWNPNLVK